MKKLMTGQDGCIKTYGQRFAEYVYDEFPHSTTFKTSEVKFPPFNKLAAWTAAQYTRVLLRWMVEQAPDHIQQSGHRFTT